MLRRLHNQAVGDAGEGKPERKKSKRQRIAQFFRSRKHKSNTPGDAPAKAPVVSEEETPPIPYEEIPPSEVVLPEQTPTIPSEKPSSIPEEQPPRPTTPAPETQQAERIEALSLDQLQALFAGAPHFAVGVKQGRRTATASYPWDEQASTRPASDSKRLDQPAFAAATLHEYQTATTQTSSSEHKSYQGYNVDVVEAPSMLSAQGVEPGTIGFTHFLELPSSDSLLAGLEESQSSHDSHNPRRLREQMQSSPERIGIRAVDMSLVHDRLTEFQDLCEAFHDSPGRMTILNHQSAGDLYANLFSKFLTPPGYDGTDDDPTGLRIQIATLVRILKLKGVWYDFSLVEWRIRLGQILWSDPEPTPEHEPHPLWTERELLLLQITLGCELLLRLDAVAYKDTEHAAGNAPVGEEEVRSFLNSRTRKLDWDLVLARRFLDNILVVKSSEHVQDLRESQGSKSRSFFAMLGVGETSEAQEASKPDIVLLPRHQARQLSGLIKFASTIQWPGTDALTQQLARSLGARDVAQLIEPLPTPDRLFPDAVTPASISVYGTPLNTPRSVNNMPDGYFGHVGKPVLRRDNSQSLRIPLSPTLSPVDARAGPLVASVGGWLSRSYLTGLVLPGEAISHFLIATLLENDKSAIALLGDSANMYGGFTYAGRTWWSKNSIVGRVFSCIDDAAECMGWISFPNPPEGLDNRWHSIHSEQVSFNDRLNDSTESVAEDSAIIPNTISDSIKPQDIVLPRDPEKPTAPLTFGHWELTALNKDLIDHDIDTGPPTENDIHVPSVTFRAGEDGGETHVLTLGFDVQFITSWPCRPPAAAATPAPSLPHKLKRSLTGTLSRPSSKHSSAKLSRRNSHGFEPLLSHPPDSTDIAPKPMYAVEDENDADEIITKRPMDVHPLHVSYTYQIVPVAHVLDPDFQPPFDMHAHVLTRTNSPTGSALLPPDNIINDKMAVLVLDARASTHSQLLARAWCAEKGYHAIIGRVGWACLACCIREARGLGVNVVIRV